VSTEPAGRGTLPAAPAVPANHPKQTPLRPASSNAVVLALVLALRDVERRRAASNMSGDGTSQRTTA